MVKPITFKQPPKVKGRTMVPLQLKVDPIDKVIIQEFAARMTETSGIKVAASNVLITTFYQRWPEERKRKLTLEKEAIHGRKYIDGITRK
ncbi:hypothetical protein [Arthrobacter sp. AL12]|uniref:hypothetical protein n=1 Tax=Arthrobacter sp. AL12 TaxID=3042241 RepID=UPI00249C2D31|nr:hypothetical protein [Arthrobacter sp. AL12]MDI3211788.1 hypothetical protein [Arthrobacter sp. AL12]